MPQRLAGTMEAALEFADEQTAKGRHCGVIFVDDFIGTGGKRPQRVGEVQRDGCGAHWGEEARS